MPLAQDRPNVIVITTDQQRTDTLSCYGSRFTHTLHLDRLAAEGTIFDRAYCANPVCTPARVSILSGLQVSRHGVWNVGMNTPEDLPLLSHRLSALGYRTHYIGKAHFQPFDGHSAENVQAVYDAPFAYYGFASAELSLGHTNYGFGGHYGAWVRRQVSQEELARYRSADLGCRATHRWGGEAYDWDLPVALHSSVWTADRTIDFLRHHSPDSPFFLAVGFQDPHHPHFVPRDYPNRVDPRDVPLPDYEEGELDDKPPFFAAQRRGTIEGSGYLGSWIRPHLPGNRRCQLSGQDYHGYLDVTDADAHLGRAYYYTMVRLIDDQMGRILRCLDETGLAPYTLLIVTTDHGELLGDHGLWMKGPFHYEPLVRIPLIVRWPRLHSAGQGAGSAGRRCASLVSQTDIAPTVLAAVGAPADGLDGVDLSPLLGDEGMDIHPDAPIRTEALIECVDAVDGLRLKTIVTRDRKLTWYAGYDFGELYDLANDPREKVNRWADVGYAADRAELLGRLLGWMEQLERHGCRPRAERMVYA